MPDEHFDSKTFLKTVSTRPGVYQMFDARGNILYVGKARNLKESSSPVIFAPMWQTQKLQH